MQTSTSKEAFLKKRNLLTSNIDIGIRKMFLKIFFMERGIVWK